MAKIIVNNRRKPNGDLSLISNLKRRHSPAKARTCFNVVTAVLSTFLAVLLLHFYPEWPSLYLCYFISTFVITVVTYLLRIRLSKIGKAELQENDSNKTEDRRISWKGFISYFFVLLAFLLVPLLLAGVLDPKIWFILIVSLASGISIAETFFYIRTR
jgi:hypothetical protein